ncbi:hypothetical protein [Chryseobacterium gambrini]|uniref:hypothetical protein n=1 Tax=Chryseobacterium gambrini TaxID=373672 RepID=UPI0022F39A49|nr:hypothetical protein [Chryseobacterium gambrini]WBX97049.1 hypothetical protein PE065_19725 [Chryseobacterium gambrini]
MKNLLEKKDWYYYIYENGDTIELSVPIYTPAPGFDAIHTLTDPEKEEYLTKGITALENRIKDMEMNFTKYVLNSWR